MVVGDLDFPGFAIAPCKTDTPLLVNADAVLSLPITAQCLQAITGGNSQIVEPRSRVDCQNLRPSPLLNLSWQAANDIAGEDSCGSFVGKALDHGKAYRKTVRNVNRNVPRYGTV